MSKLLWGGLLAIFLVVSIAVMPTVLANNNPENELDAIFSGAGSSEVFQLAGGQVRPIQPNATTETLFDIPYQDYLRDKTLFGDFLGLFDGNLTPPQINSTWRESYLDSIRAPAPAAKGSMTESRRPHYLKPVLINEPQF